MKKLTALLLSLLIISGICAQNFSNKGKDFWLGYGYHVNMAGNPAGGGSQDMVLYFTSDKNATVTVEMPSNGYSQTYTVLANQVTSSNPIPKAGTNDARIYDTGYYNRGIHIYSDVDIVAYAHIYNASISGASLLFPTNTLGKDYYVISYNQSSNATSANSFAFVQAVEDNTTVEITPSVSNKNNKPAGTPFTVNLSKGQIYSLMGTTNGTTGTDLTGTHIKTINSGGSCKKIAVFCGSGKISIGGTTNANNQAGSADNLFAQAMPASAWGLKYLTSPTGSQPSDYYRICVTDPNTIVKVNGNVIASSYLQRGFFYELKNSTPLSTPGNGISVPNVLGGVYNLIEADKPINVAQYCTTQAQDGNPNTSFGGDPEMIYLSPVEQTINNITLYSASKYLILQSYINVIVRNGGVKSFTLDGVSRSTNFSPHPRDPNYSSAIFTVSSGSHSLYSDTGFNAIAYGFGQAESYGYNAGTNIKDLYTPVFQNPYARLSFAATCVGTPFQFSVPLSYQPTSLTWDFGNNANLSPNASIGPITPITDSISVVGGQNLYYYSPANGVGSKTFVYQNSGIDTIKIYATNPSPDGCSSSNAEYDLPVVINPLPVANYTVNAIRCISDSIKFTDSSYNLGNSSVVNGLWYWGDGTTDSLKNPLHKFLIPKIYNIRYRPITDFGCIGDTTIPFNISGAPIAKFGVSDSCIGKSITLTDSSTISFGSIVKWYWDYGDGTRDTLISNAPRYKTYNTAGTVTVSLIVENNTGCKSIPFVQTITIRPLPVPYFNLPNICLPVGAAQFYDSTNITDNSNNFTYRWNFGDGGIDSVKNPLHYFTSLGPYNVKLSVTSIYGCKKDSTEILSTIYQQPHANFAVSNEVCLRDTTLMTDSSDGKGSSLVKWKWSFGDGATDTLQNTKHVYATASLDTVRLFVYTDKGCISDTMTRTTIVNPLPVAGFINSSIICETRQITFNDTSKASVGNITNWYWNMGNGNLHSFTANNSFNEVYQSWGKDTVSLMVQNSKGCKSDTLSKIITVSPLPHVGFVLPEVCLADALAQFTDTSSIANNNTISSYQWNFNAGSPPIVPGPTLLSTTIKNGSAHYNTVGNYMVSLKIISNNGCDTLLTKPFTVNGSVPHADFVTLKSADLCSNDSIRIQDASTVDFGTVTKNEIFWDLINSPAADSLDDNPYLNKGYAHLYKNFQQPSSLLYSVKMIAHSGNSNVCSNAITKIITLHQSPKVLFTTLPGICNDTSARQITQAAEIGNVPGSFAYYGTGVNATGIFTPQSTTPGAYPIKYVYTSTTFGCRDSATQNEIVWPSPVAKWGVNSPDCEKNNILFTDSSLANYSNIVNRYWNFGDGTSTVNTTATTFAKKYASANIYTASLRVMTDSGCRSIYHIQNINVHYLPVPNFGMPGICLPGGKGQFTDSSTIADGSQSLFSYSWNFGDPNDLTPATIPNPVHKYSALGPYNVQLKVTSKDGCIDSLTKQLTTVYPQPKADFNINPNNICLGDNIQFTDLSNGITSAVSKWNWDLANGNTSILQSPIKQFTDSGTLNIILFVYNGQNCVSDTVIKQVTVNPYPKLILGPNLVVLLGGVITINPQYYFGTNLQFLWTPPTYLSSDTAVAPRSTPTDDIQYKLTLTGIGNCSVTDSIYLTVLKNPLVPNIFSPNGDGINDKWVIKYLNQYPGCTVDVFNRYGQKVFHSDGYGTDWDGNYNEKPLPVGTYYYIINPKNGRNTMSGSVSIVR